MDVKIIYTGEYHFGDWLLITVLIVLFLKGLYKYLGRNKA